MQTMPRQKDGLSFHEVDKELVVYDTQRELAFCLNPVAAQVLKMCDGKTTLEEARGKLDQSPAAEDLLSLTLSTLHSNQLLADGVTGMDRRQFIARWGKVALALPLVAMVMAPVPAAAASRLDPSGSLNDKINEGGVGVDTNANNANNSADGSDGEAGLDPF